MSGGVDSSVAAWLLREQGYDVRWGVHAGMGRRSAALPKGEGRCEKQHCCSAADAADARRVADRLDIPFHVVDFQEGFDRIVDYFIAEYTAGRTAEPVYRLQHLAEVWQAVRLCRPVGGGVSWPPVTMHGSNGCPTARLPCAEVSTSGRDQSYALFGIERHRARAAVVPHRRSPQGRDSPNGRAAWPSSRREARQSRNLFRARPGSRPDSSAKRAGPLETYGEIVTTDGAVVGHHDGFERYTIGQRKGLRLAFGEPRYVIRIEPDTCRVVIGTHEELARSELIAAGANWLVGVGGQWSVSSGQWSETKTKDLRPKTKDPNVQISKSPNLQISLALRPTVKIRYRSRPMPATVELLPNNRFHIRFDEPSFGVAPGQAAVCYDGNRVLGGGWIE